MDKIGIIICGNSGIDYLNYNYDYEVIRSYLIIENKTYIDYIDIKAEDFYDKLVKYPDIDIKTSQTPTGEIIESYKKMKNKGFNKLIVITVSSKLSGVYQGAVLASQMVEGMDIRVIDSKSVSYGEVLLFEKALELIKLRKGLDEIELELNNSRNKTEIFVLVDTVKYLVKNGRLSTAKGFIANLLKIKPLLKINEEGMLVPYERIRTFKRAKKRLLEIISIKIKNRKAKVFLAHTNNIKLAEKIKKKIESEKVIVEIVPLTPVVGAHAGPGTLGVGIYIE